jgi:hypothetical protein
MDRPQNGRAAFSQKVADDLFLFTQFYSISGRFFIKNMWQTTMAPALLEDHFQSRLFLQDLPGIPSSETA